jgi:hypothetical protein
MKVPGKKSNCPDLIYGCPMAIYVCPIVDNDFSAVFNNWTMVIFDTDMKSCDSTSVHYRKGDRRTEIIDKVSFKPDKILLKFPDICPL